MRSFWFTSVALVSTAVFTVVAEETDDESEDESSFRFFKGAESLSPYEFSDEMEGARDGPWLSDETEVARDSPRPESIESIDVDLDNPTFELIVFFVGIISGWFETISSSADSRKDILSVIISLWFKKMIQVLTQVLFNVWRTIIYF